MEDHHCHHFHCHHCHCHHFHCHHCHCQIKEMIGEADKDDSGAVDFGEILENIYFVREIIGLFFGEENLVQQ